jgi:hypothetical protein
MQMIRNFSKHLDTEKLSSTFPENSTLVSKCPFQSSHFTITVDALISR